MRVVLRWLLIAMALSLVVFWVLGGGFGKIIKNAGTFSLSLRDIINKSSPLTSFQLPFAPSSFPQIPTAYNPETDGRGTGSGGRSNGAQSPYAGMVAIAQSAAMAQSPSAQYITISVTPGASVDISGWTLQSALSGAIATIPQAASPFIMGRVNAVGNAVLSSGSTAQIVTGASPVGVSFSENTCTGYLGTLQPYVPALPQNCPSPNMEIPRTPESVARLGSNCFDYIATLPPCTFPSNPPSSLSSSCRGEIQTKLSYNGCVNTHRTDDGFSRNSWRMYLAQGKPLWGVQHDVIRLLDREGKLVSVLNY